MLQLFGEATTGAGIRGIPPTWPNGLVLPGGTKLVVSGVINEVINMMVVIRSQTF